MSEGSGRVDESSFLRLDRIDYEIIRILQEDGRTMYKDIAKRLHVSIPTVKARIERLKELGVIRRITAIIDSGKLLGRIRAFLLLQVSPGELDRISKKLSNIREVREVYITTGPMNMIVKVEARDFNHLGELITEKISKINGITNLTTIAITKSIKEEYGAYVEPETPILVRCDFCKSPIVGRPIIEYIKGGKYFFSSRECAEAFKKKLGLD